MTDEAPKKHTGGIRRMAVGPLGQVIRRLREEQCITSQDLADRLGMSKQAMSKIECGQLVPSGRRCYEIAAILKVSGDVLVALAGHVPEDVTSLMKRPQIFRLVRACERLSDAEVDKLSARIEKVS